MRIAAFALVLGIAALASTAGAAEPTTAIWIDVRSADEYAGGHLPGAINIPHDELAVRIDEVTRDFDAPIRLYCRRGVRAQFAKLGLESRGYRNVTNEGGYSALAARLAAARPRATECAPAAAPADSTNRETMQRGIDGQGQDC